MIRHNVSSARWKRVRRGWHNCHHGRLKCGVIVVRYNGQHGRLEEIEEGPT